MIVGVFMWRGELIAKCTATHILVRIPTYFSERNLDIYMYPCLDKLVAWLVEHGINVKGANYWKSTKEINFFDHAKVCKTTLIDNYWAINFPFSKPQPVVTFEQMAVLL